MAKRILAVDDEADSLEMLEFTLESEGLDVLTATNGTEALARYAEEDPDLVILDVRMPGMSGFEVCKRIRQASDVPILFLSARGQAEDRLTGLEGGADDYLTKPVLPRELVLKVRRLLERTDTPPTLADTPFEYFCALCTRCLSEPDVVCPECGAEPPRNGWQSTAQSRYPYLGKLIDDRYLLDRFAGAGAVGQVYRAWMESVQRHFACKIVDTQEHGTDHAEAIRQGFEREAEVMSRLHNPHIVGLHDWIQLEPGVFALFVDYVHGQPLDELLRIVGRMRPRLALEMVRQVANGLHEAHEAGLVHRDVKPANILLEQLPATGFFVRIVDFGIAHEMEDASDQFRGTPLYASPEQCRCDDVIDARSDIYSLGCVLFHSLTGQPPFQGAGKLETMRQQIEESPPQLSDLLFSEVPDELEELLASMLAKDPSDRPDSLQQVTRALDELLATAELTDQGSRVIDLPLAETTSTAEDRTATQTSGQEEVEEGATTKSRGTLTYVMGFELPGMKEGVDPIEVVALDETGRRAVLAEREEGIHILDVGDGGRHRAKRFTDAEIRALAASQKYDVMFACDEDGHLWRMAYENGARPTQTVSLEEVPRAMAIAGANERLLFGGDEGVLRAVSFSGGAVEEIERFGAPITALAVDDSESVIAVGTADGIAILRPGEEPVTLKDAGADARSIVLSDDAFLAAYLDEDGTVCVFGTVDGRSLFAVPVEEANLQAIAFADELELHGAGLQARSLTIWKLLGGPADSSAYM